MAIGAHLLIGFGALAVGIGMFALRWIGGGDAKLFAAAALWLGAPAALSYVVMTGMAGGAALALILSSTLATRADEPVDVELVGKIRQGARGYRVHQVRQELR